MKFVDTLSHNRRALGFVSFVVFFRSCASHAVVSSHTVAADTTLTNLSPIVTFCDTSSAGGNLEITLPDCTTLAENTDDKNQRCDNMQAIFPPMCHSQIYSNPKCMQLNEIGKFNCINVPVCFPSACFQVLHNCERSWIRWNEHLYCEDNQCGRRCSSNIQQ